jgi:hypothetical protein
MNDPRIDVILDHVSHLRTVVEPLPALCARLEERTEAHGDRIAKCEQAGGVFRRGLGALELKVALLKQSAAGYGALAGLIVAALGVVAYVLKLFPAVVSAAAAAP